MGIALDEQERTELLGTHGTAVLATVTPSGAPLPLPVWYVVVDDRLYIRTPRSAKRLEHIAADPRVGLVVHAGDAWQELRGFLVNGHAEVVADDAEDARVRERLAERFADRLPPPLPPAVANHYAETVVLRIEPARTVSWDNRKIQL